jgi:hypothetical protein
MTPAAFGDREPVVPSRLLAAVACLDDLLGAPTLGAGHDLVDWLRHEQASIRWLATCFRRLGHDIASAGARSDLARILCLDIDVTTRAEAELLIPALRDAGAPAVVLEDVEVSHECLRALAQRLHSMTPGARRFDARAAMLARLADWHASLVEEALYPLARQLIGSEALALLGSRYADLRAELHLRLDDERAADAGIEDGRAPRPLPH